MIRDLNYVLDYMNRYIQDKDMQDSEPMLNYRDIELVLRYIQELENRINETAKYIEEHKEPLHHYFDEPDCDYWIATNPDDMLNTLRGVDKQ